MLIPVAYKRYNKLKKNFFKQYNKVYTNIIKRKNLIVCLLVMDKLETILKRFDKFFHL